MHKSEKLPRPPIHSARDSKWLSGVAAVAAGALGAHSAQASIVGATGLSLPVYDNVSQGTSQNQAIDFDGDMTSDIQFVADGGSISAQKSEFEQSTGVAADPNNAGYAAALTLGETIDGSLTYNYNGPFTGTTDLITNDGNTPPSIVGGFAMGAGEQYVGIQLNLADGTHYGWVGFETTDQDNGSMAGIIDGYAYEADTDTAIPAGVPEPSSLALLALGAAGIASYRGRRYR
jgi:hypothetical protein